MGFKSPPRKTDLPPLHECIEELLCHSKLLRNGVNVGNPDDHLEPRTMTGVSQDGRYLFLMVIDGRQPGYSEGCNQAEAATWLRQVGAWEGMNLDGGGTT